MKTKLKLASGEDVVIRPGSHLLVHKEDGILDLLEDALGQIQASDANSTGLIEKEIVFGRIIGTTCCVETTEKDEIVYAQRWNGDESAPRYHSGLSRFVKNREMEKCESLVLVLKAENSEKTSFFVVTGFVGKKTPREPWDKHCVGGESEFWSGHALVWGSFLVVSGSETNVCPW